MTDNEIIKALECMLGKYSTGELMDCHGCVFETQDLCYENASEGLVKFALALINRQKAEIERLENSLAISKKETQRYVENYKRQKKEMEEYRNIIERATEGIREVKAMLPRELAKERAKAVKEFAERLESKHRRILDYDEAGFSAPTDVVYVETIDNLVKEFTEETT